MEIPLIICAVLVILKMFVRCFKTPKATINVLALIEQEESIAAAILLKTRVQRVPVSYLEKYQWN
jgi:hypothetical protein